jgi:hypothetical protein
MELSSQKYLRVYPGSSELLNTRPRYLMAVKDIALLHRYR